MDRFERAGAAFAALARTMAKLRQECPWDGEQTHQSLRQYLLEECFEAADAIDRADARELCEELGDVLFQVVFHAEIARETGAFDLAAVASGIDAKLVRRHPHVFGDPNAEHPSWEELKAQEKPERRDDRFAGIGAALPALLKALRVSEKAAAVGFDWPEVSGVIDKVDEEWAELRAELDSHPLDRDAVADELGDLLFTLSNLGRHLQIDPEAALAAASLKFQRRFRTMEAIAKQRGLEIGDMSLDRLEALWKYAKSSS